MRAKRNSDLTMSFVMKALCVTLAAGFALPAQAHHASSPHFDKSRTVSLTGKFTALKFVNPHAYIYFDVETDGVTEKWRCELRAASQLKRQGWSADMFSPGEIMLITGSPARREANVCAFSSARLSDGSRLYGREQYKPVEDDAKAQLWADRPKTLTSGEPNLLGPWRTRSFYRWGNHIGSKYNLSMTSEGRDAGRDYEMIYDDPIIKCHFVNIIDAWNTDEHVNNIFQAAKDEDHTITLQYGFMDLKRTVYMGEDNLPADQTPRAEGYSVGRWDDETLVVRTSGFTEGVLDHQYGEMHSDQMEITERFTVDQDHQLLIREYEIMDPLYLRSAARGYDAQELVSTPYAPYACEELSGKNNIRPE